MLLSIYLSIMVVLCTPFSILIDVLVGYPVTCEDEDSEGCNYYFTYGKIGDENATTVFVVSKKGKTKSLKLYSNSCKL